MKLYCILGRKNIFYVLKFLNFSVIAKKKKGEKKVSDLILYPNIQSSARSLV